MARKGKDTDARTGKEVIKIYETGRGVKVAS